MGGLGSGAKSRLRYEEISAMRGENCTLQEIADKFGVSKQRISQVLLNPPPPQPSATDMLAHVGQALYGERWPHPLAKALGKHNRQIWRYINGEAALAPDHEIFAAALALLSERQLALNAAADKLEQWLAHQ